MVKQRLDTLLAERGLFSSRTRAAASVMAGEVTVGLDGRRAAKPGKMVPIDAQLSVRERAPYVSRGGLKLANALDALELPVQGRRVVLSTVVRGRSGTQSRRRRGVLLAAQCPPLPGEPVDHVKPLWFYLPGLVVGTLPWSLLLVPLVHSLLRRDPAEGGRRPPTVGVFLVAAGGCVLFFSLSGCKRAAYVLPACRRWRWRWGATLRV